MTSRDQIGASRAALIEVLNVLGALREHIVVVGGWVPELLYPNAGHLGSIDVDLAIAPSAESATAYQSILKRLTAANYSHHTNPTRFTKQIAGVHEPVKVDLISGQYQSVERAASLQVGELQLSCLRGVDLALEASEYRDITGSMPDGASNTVRARVVRPEAFILMKAFALEERARDKDAYDIAFVLQCYRPNVEALAERVRLLLANGLASRGYEVLKQKFATIDSVGPKWAADVHRSQGHDYEQARRAAFEHAQALTRAIDRATAV